MCLSVPGKVLKVEGDLAIIDYRGELREAGTALLPDIREDEYVIVSAKMIVQRVPEDEAKSILSLWDGADKGDHHG